MKFVSAQIVDAALQSGAKTPTQFDDGEP